MSDTIRVYGTAIGADSGYIDVTVTDAIEDGRLVLTAVNSNDEFRVNATGFFELFDEGQAVKNPSTDSLWQMIDDLDSRTVDDDELAEEKKMLQRELFSLITKL